MKDYIYFVNAYGEDDSQSNSYAIQVAAAHNIPGCDYTADYEDVHAGIENVLSSAEEAGIIRRIDKKKSFEFEEDGPEKYFGNRLDLLKKKVSSLSVKEFTTDDQCIFKIRQLIDETLGKYIYYVPYGEIMTLDSFIREYAGNMRYINRKNQFTLENIVLYHY